MKVMTLVRFVPRETDRVELTCEEKTPDGGDPVDADAGTARTAAVCTVAVGRSSVGRDTAVGPTSIRRAREFVVDVGC